jgi:shikimate kinase
MPLVILIGASGSGKTTIARAIQERYAESVDVFFFDRIGVPSIEQMIARYGSGEGCEILDTSLISLDESVLYVSARLGGY